jgi:DNA (cytosine-5)-methyltransferase 1
MLNHVDLCSGIGGFALGFQWAELSKPVMFCDIEPWSRKILAKHWPDVPIEEDVKVLSNDPEKIPELGRNSILTAGYPCQPFSQAGKRRGEEDDRHIWPYIHQIVASKRPTWCVFENVYGHVSMGLDTVLSDLEADGYATRPFIVPACSVDAPHRRDRVFIIARAVSYTTGSGLQGIEQSESDGKGGGEGLWPKPSRVCGGEPTGQDVGDTEGIGWNRRTTATGQTGQAHQQEQSRSQVWGEPSGSGEDVADSTSEGLEGRERSQYEGYGERFAKGGIGSGCVWPTEPPVGRVVNGIPRRVDRIKGLGNAIVPQIAMQIGLTIKAVHNV